MTTSPSPEPPSAPAFSFLTPAYRSEETLPRTVESVLAQTRDDWELVVVDNGNADAIVEAVRPYLSDPRILLVRQENKGVVGGTMAAADRATGRYLVPLNSDDAITPDFCARIAEVFATDPGVGAVTCDAHLFVDPGEQRLARSYLQSAGLEEEANPLASLRISDVIDGPSPYYGSAIRRDVFDAAGGFWSDTPTVDDLDFWLRIIVAGHDVRRIPDRLGRFRMEAGSLSRPDDPERIEAFEKQRETALTRAAEASQDPEALAALDRVLRRLRYVASVRRARIAFRRGDVDEARGHLRAAWAQKRTARVAAITIGVTVVPGVLRSIQPGKQRLYARLDHLRRLGLRNAVRSLRR